MTDNKLDDSFTRYRNLATFALRGIHRVNYGLVKLDGLYFFSSFSTPVFLSFFTSQASTVPSLVLWWSLSTMSR